MGKGDTSGLRNPEQLHQSQTPSHLGRVEDEPMTEVRKFSTPHSWLKQHYPKVVVEYTRVVCIAGTPRPLSVYLQAKHPAIWVEWRMSQ